MPRSNKGDVELNEKGRPKFNAAAVKRTIRLVVKFYPVLFPVICLCSVFSSAISAIPSIFTQKIVAIATEWTASGDWAGAKAQIVPLIRILVTLYAVSIVAIVLQTQLNAIMTQGFLSKLRRLLFDKMQDLPIRYFDTHKHGDIMSHYTNDVDTLRELVSQSIPALLRSGSIVLVVFGIMLWYSVPMTAMVLLGVVAMTLVSGKLGGGSAKYFVAQRKSVAAAEGFIQEMMAGQKVVKVFNHESASAEGFDALNEELFQHSRKANSYANALGPIIMNIGNILYVLIAVLGGAYLLAGLPNPSISGKALDISILIAFLNMTKQFTGNLNQLTQQVHAIVMGMAGADRVFSLMDEAPESDNGYVTLVNAEIAPDGTVTESDRHTGHWAWKHPHGDGTLTYTELKGDVRLVDVDFSYVEGKQVLTDVNVFAEPGQKVAFVGATGAGKTTITNLINRFYDIEDGKIRYDGININKIKKSDLRRSLGLVLQETNLFTGTVMENIRYGKLDATDEECRAAAKLAGADDFITRLPQGYDTPLANNGSNLSQGQRQLIAIARAAVADPPVMILDEATSSIDTRTEAIVQRGMDKLMEGRTVFVIAHRLSTVMDSDVIMVLDHGRIIERGSHEQLIAEKGTYYRLYTGAFELE
ncbi:MAG: ABC transporter ATP-binding protein [Ruminococcaceae bacterium]|jgi:ATP-binding cassette subfamily B protein|nr:ABC transporter ATP-binding protein [Oscillospiraceae bacterium]